MKLKILTTIFITTLLSTNVFGFDKDNFIFKVNNLNFNYSKSISIEKDEILFDMTELFSQLGVKAYWSATDKSTYCTKGDISLKLFDNSNKAIVNGKQTTMSIATVKLNDIDMLIPLKFVSEVFGASVIINDNEINIITAEHNTSKLDYKSLGTINMTYDEALKKVKTNSPSLKQLERSVDSLEDINKTLVETQIIGIPDENGNVNINLASQVSALATIFSNNLIIENADYEKIVYNSLAELTLKSQLTSLKLNEYGIALKEKQLEIAKQDLNIAKLKYELGMVSKLEYDIASSSYEKKLKDFEISKQAINIDFINLTTLMGSDGMLNKYSVSYDIQFKPLEQINLIGYISTKINEDPTIKVKEQKVKQYEFEADIYSSNNLNTTQSEKARQNNIDTANDNVKDARTELEKKIRTAYTEILNLEENYKLALLDLEDAKNQIEISKVRYNGGIISFADYNKSELNLASCEFAIKSIVYQHNLKVYQFYNPYLL